MTDDLHDLRQGLRYLWPWRIFDRPRVICRLLLERLKLERVG